MLKELLINEILFNEAKKVFDNKLDISIEKGVEYYLRKVLASESVLFDYDDIKTELQADTFILELNANKALQKVFEDANRRGLPIARYDTEKKEPYLEYPDGRREYGLEKIKTIASMHKLTFEQLVLLPS